MFFALTVFDDIGDVLDTRLFDVNGTPITLASIILFLFVTLVVIGLARLFARLVITAALRRFEVDETVQYAIIRGVQYAIVTIGVIVSLQFVGINLSTLAIIFGFLAVGIGFGLQNLTSNFIAGLILLAERPIRIGDRITVGGLEGDVLEVNIRSTIVRTLRNVRIIVPNADFISQNVINWSHGELRVVLWVDVGVSYDSDLETVERSLLEVAAENDAVLGFPEPEVQLIQFGDSAWDMRLLCSIPDPKRNLRTRSELNKAIVRKFRAYGVEIPYPQRDLHLRGPQPIQVASGEATRETSAC